MSSRSDAGVEGLPSAGFSAGATRKTGHGAAVSFPHPSSAQPLRVAIDLACPTRSAVIDAAGVKLNTFNAYLIGRRRVPPAVTRVLAGMLREQSAALLVAAAGLEAR